MTGGKHQSRAKTAKKYGQDFGPYQIEIQQSAAAKHGRLLLCSHGQLNKGKARSLLQGVANSLAATGIKNNRFEVLTASGGFLSFPWPTGKPSPSFGELCQLGEAFCRSIFDSKLRRSLRRVTDWISFGIDSVEEQGLMPLAPHVELVALLDLKAGRYHWTGKSYPTVAQERYLIRADVPSHFVKIGRKRVVLLGCHDLNAFSARAAANAKGWRKKLGREMRKAVEEYAPVLVLQHPHVTDTAQSWSTAWSGLADCLPPSSAWLGAGRFAPTGRRRKPRGKLSKVLAGTRKGLTTDILVWPVE